MRKNSAGAPQIVDSNNYYPFGLSHIGQEKGLLGGYLNYKFGGKESQETGRFDFGARFYMPDLGRWGVIDPLAETSRRFTPYNYAYNNPISFIDPDGRKAMNPDEERMSFASGGALEYNLSGRSGSFSNFLGFDDPIDALNRNVKAGGGGSTTVGETQWYKDIMAYLAGDSPTFQFPKGKEDYYKEKYPAFYDFVKNQLPKMVGDANFMKALSSASGFSVEELSESFQYGKGMFLKVMDLTIGDAEYLYGGITESNTRNTAAIDTPVLAWFEKANRNPNSVEGLTNIMYMSALIGHETAHWGDDIKRTVKYGATGLESRFGDVGNFFEERAFGGRMGSYSVGVSGSIRNYVQTNFKLLQSIFK
ncbi:RHS repeat-associated core domain-containing protein [Chryseobacterium lactis]|uniref:RHS repeat-associated core domain-containing protein n=1 Tax=Chryseobacterium lactis TaxID=1241981 RepID=UPI0016265B70|nr:RHS repeat-associated core domain-containing protein [Chryseobacterium lactis]